MKVTIDGNSYEVVRAPDNVTVDDAIYRVRVESQGLTRKVFVNDFAYQVTLPEDYAGSSELAVVVDGRPRQVLIEGKVRAAAPRPSRQAAAPKRGPTPEGAVVAAMAGRIVSIAVEAGQAVKAGQVLLVLEAMKMENEVSAPKDGVVKAIPVAPGARVNEGDALVVLE